MLGEIFFWWIGVHDTVAIHHLSHSLSSPRRCRSKVYIKKYDRLDDIKDIRNFIRVALNSINSSVEEFFGTLFNCGDIWHWKNGGLALFGSFLYSRDEQTRWTGKDLVKNI